MSGTGEAAVPAAPKPVFSPMPAQRGRWRFGPTLDTGAFSRELGLLLAAGIPLLDALAALREKQQQHAGATPDALLARIAQRIAQGAPLSVALGEALAAANQSDPLLVASVGAAERSGQVPAALAAHARHCAWQAQLRHQLVGAAVYPVLLVGASVAVALFLLVFVVPRFASVLEGREATLPLASRVLIATGQAAAVQPALTVGLTVLLMLSPLLLWQWPPARAALQQALVQAPLIGPRLKMLALARLYRTLALLLGAGVPVLAALQAARAVAGARLDAALDATAQAVARGERFSEALEAHGLATPVARRMVRVGERSGNLGPMLEQAAAFHDDEVRRLTDLATRVLNPALMLVMGAVIGTLVVLLYLPIFELAEGLQ